MREFYDLMVHQGYLYHATPKRNLRSIARLGLKPSEEGYEGPGVYFAKTEQGALAWTEFNHDEEKNLAILRVNMDDLVERYGLYHAKNQKGLVQGWGDDNDDALVDATIPAELLEYKLFGESTYHALSSAHVNASGESQTPQSFCVALEVFDHENFLQSMRDGKLQGVSGVSAGFSGLGEFLKNNDVALEMPGKDFLRLNSQAKPVDYTALMKNGMEMFLRTWGGPPTTKGAVAQLFDKGFDPPRWMQYVNVGGVERYVQFPRNFVKEYCPVFTTINSIEDLVEVLQDCARQYFDVNKEYAAEPSAQAAVLKNLDMAAWSALSEAMGYAHESEWVTGGAINVPHGSTIYLYPRVNVPLDQIENVDPSNEDTYKWVELANTLENLGYNVIFKRPSQTVKHAAISKVWLSPDNRVVKVPEGKEHWEAAEELDLHDDSGMDPFLGALQEGWIRVGAFNSQTWVSVWKLDRRNLHTLQTFLMQHPTYRRDQLVIEQVTVANGRNLHWRGPLSEFLEFNSPNEVWQASKVASAHSYGCVMAELDSSAQKAVRQISEELVSDEELYTQPDDPYLGRGDVPHVTLLYGIRENEAHEAVKQVLATQKLTSIKVNGLSLFEPEDYDVVKLDVVLDEELQAMRLALEEAFPDFKNTHGEYKPHVTVAYVKKGLGREIIERAKPIQDNIALAIKRFTYSKQDDTKIIYDLDGNEVGVVLGLTKSANVRAIGNVNDLNKIHTRRSYLLQKKAAPVREVDVARTYYHGTRSEEAFKGISAEGLKAPEITDKRKLTPVKGKVYVTPSFPYAMIYALGADMFSQNLETSKTFLLKDGEYGYIFEVPGELLTDVSPDEDSTGQILYYALKGYSDKPINDPEHARAKRELVDLANKHLTPKQLREVKFGNYVEWAVAGKKLDRVMPDWLKYELLDLEAHVANAGSIKPTKAWRFKKLDAEKINRDGSNFFDYAEEVPLNYSSAAKKSSRTHMPFSEASLAEKIDRLAKPPYCADLYYHVTAPESVPSILATGLMGDEVWVTKGEPWREYTSGACLELDLSGFDLRRDTRWPDGVGVYVSTEPIPASCITRIFDFIPEWGLREDRASYFLRRRGHEELVKKVEEKFASRSVVARPEQWSTSEFKTWFGNSVTVNSDGTPMVFYHGTSKDKDFTAFKDNRRGMFFTPAPDVASDYAESNDSQDLKYEDGKYVSVNTSPRVIPVYLKLTKPYQLTEAEKEEYAHAGNYAKIQRDIADRAKMTGHDGIIYPDGAYVVFKPSQIKSAIGNKGTFSDKDNKLTAAAD